MKNKPRFARTKSQCRQSLPRQVKDTAYMKFKPFSEECTLDHIQQKLQSFRNTMTYHQARQRKNSQQTPLAARLKSIIGGKRRGKKRQRRNNFTELDIRSSENSHFSENIEEKYRRLSKLKQRSISLSRSNFKECETITQCPQPILPNTTISHVRHDLSQQAIAEQNAFFDMIHKPKSSILLANFNKNNCFLFSRSKHKVFAVEQERARPVEVKESSNKFQSFGAYFYGSYMKKYVERRKFLGKKGILIKMVAK